MIEQMKCIGTGLTFLTGIAGLIVLVALVMWLFTVVSYPILFGVFILFLLAWILGYFWRTI